MMSSRLKKEGGFAMLAAIIILSLLIVLGLMAFMVSESEIRVVGNIDMAKKLYFIAEQAVDRILLHLHYNPEGPIKALGVDMYGSSATILPRQVMKNVGPLAIDPDSQTPIIVDNNYVIEAAINYKDWETKGGQIARPVNQPFRILVKVKHKGSQYTKAYEVEVQPVTPYNFAYFTQNADAAPDSDWPSYNSNPVFRHRGRAANVTFNDAFGYCPSTPSFFESRVIGDLIGGDLYLGGNDPGFYVRGGPTFLGSIWWRTLYPYYDPSRSQSSGCSGSCNKHPSIGGGIKSYAHPIRAFEERAEDSFWFANIGTTPGGANRFGVQSAYDAANYRFANEKIGTSYYVTRILFMHNVNVNGNGECEERGSAQTCDSVKGRVGSAITPRLNNGRVEDPGDTGTFVAWRVRWDHPYAINEDHTLVYANAGFQTSSWYRAALYGDNIANRTREILLADPNNCVYNSTVRSCGDLGCKVVNDANRRLTLDLGTTLGTAEVRPALVPDFGKTCADLGGQGSFNTTRASGIIFVDGDVIVSGVVDGRVSIFATGDIILDHEIEYEKDPLKYPDDLNDVDMLGLFARGDVIIPHNIALEYPSHPTLAYADDWSDPLLGDGNFAPQGWFDSAAYGSYIAGPLLDDDGSEDLHAIIHAAGFECKYPNEGGADCREWTDSTLQDRKTQARKDMRVGFYAMPKTFGIISGNTWSSGRFGDPSGKPFLRLVGDEYRFHNMANQSGPLRMTGVVIQDYPGRVGYDYYTGVSNLTWGSKNAIVDSSCTDGVSSLVYTCTYDAGTDRYHWAEDYNSASYEPCNTVGHESFELTWDPRLRYTHPPMPFDAAYFTTPPANTIPKAAWWFGYGMAAYQITSWKEITSDKNIASNDGY